MGVTFLSDGKSEAAIFSRIVGVSLPKFSREMARAIVELKLSEEDQSRVDELCERNGEGTITPEEQQELMNYVKVGNHLAILQSKARKYLKDLSAGESNGARG